MCDSHTTTRDDSVKVNSSRTSFSQDTIACLDHLERTSIRGDVGLWSSQSQAMTRRYCTLVRYRSRQKKVWYRICDLFAKTNLSLVYSANKNFKLTLLSPVEFSYETGPFGAMCGLYAALMRS